MKCNNCGFDCGENAIFCPECGVKLETPAPEIVNETVNDIPNENPHHSEFVQNIPQFRDKVGTTLKSNLFLTLCILVSVTAGVGIVSGAFPIFPVLETIFLWLVFAKARKNQLDVKNLRCLSGVVYAKYVVNWVLSALLLVLSLILGVFSDVLISAGLVSEITSELSEEFSQFEDLMGLIGAGIGISLVVKLIAAATFISAIIIVLINVLGYKNIHRFTKSFYTAVAQNDEQIVEKASTAASWFIVFAVFVGISALTSIGDGKAFIQLASHCASLIVLTVLLKKYSK